MRLDLYDYCVEHDCWGSDAVKHAVKAGHSLIQYAWSGRPVTGARRRPGASRRPIKEGLTFSEAVAVMYDDSRLIRIEVAEPEPEPRRRWGLG